MIVSVGAAEFLPYLGMWNRICRADLFVVADTCRFKHREYQNRNRVRTASGWTWFTLPVNKQHRNAPIGEITLRPHHEIDRSWAVLEANYRGRAEHWAHYAEDLRRSIYQDRLFSVNWDLLQMVHGALRLSTPMKRASEILSCETEDFSLLSMTVAEVLGADTLLAGAGNIGTLPKRFSDWGIDFLFQDFVNLPYPQVFGGWHPRMSVIDCLLTHGGEYTRRIVESGWRPEEEDDG